MIPDAARPQQAEGPPPRRAHEPDEGRRDPVDPDSTPPPCSDRISQPSIDDCSQQIRPPALAAPPSS